MGFKITDELKEEIRSRNRLEDVVGAYVALKRSGKSLVGLCPFHNEKTPSFSVSPDKQLYYCFGCGASGDVFDFVMQYERLEFVEAVERLAERAGIVLDIENETPSQRLSRRTRDVLLEINTLAARYFRYRLLRSKLAAGAREYLSSRGVSAKSAELFSLGYAPDKWDDLYTLLAKRGFSTEVILQSGLVKKGRASAYDVFRDRVIFPIRDVNRRVVGFGGRTLPGKGESQPKYITSPETLLFNKSHVLYGIDLARDSIKRLERSVNVEGYMDVISCHQHGFTNVVAPLGTSLTTAQARLLLRYAPEVIILFDADTAGQEATLRSLELLRREGLRVKVATLDEGSDPDSFLKENGASALQTLLESAANLTEYRINVIVSATDLSDASLKAEASRRCIEALVEVIDPIERSEYSKYAAYQLRVDEEVFTREVERAVRRGRRAGDTFRKNRYTRQVESAVDPAASQESLRTPGAGDALAEKLTKAELLLLGMILDNPSLASLVEGELIEESFSSPSVFRIFRMLCDEAKQGDSEELLSAILNRIDDEAERQLIHRLSVGAEKLDSVSDPRRTVLDCALWMEENRVGRKISSLQLDLREAEKSGDSERIRLLGKQIMDCQRLRQEIRAKMSNPNEYR